jgi:adenosine deaminase
MKTEKARRHTGVKLVLSLFMLWTGGLAVAQAPKAGSAGKKQTVEQQGELQLAAARSNPLQLRQFLKKMPKGADLHYHLSGGVYAESFLRAAVEDGLCVDEAKLALVKCAASGEEAKNVVPAAEVYRNQGLYDQLVNSFSMRSFVPYAGVSGHDHFFDAFAKFAGTSPVHKPEWVDEAASRAAVQNEQYLELMETPDFSLAQKIAEEIGWSDDLKHFREELLARGLRDNVKTAVESYKEIEKKRREIERCGPPGASEACTVDVRYLCQVLRGKARETVFAQALLCFEAAEADPERIVGLNFVMPEDGYISMKDYALHMRMVKYLHEIYPKVHIALHAGELAYGLVPPEGLCCHIRQAVEAGAERIGHGVDVMYENRPHELLKEMAARHVMVEVNLTSNDLILGISGKNHPLPMYRWFDVPVALSTDDEGVSRIDLTNEYVRAVETYGLKYAELKNMGRTGLEHAFLPGSSLWEKRDAFSKSVAPCAKDALGSDKPSGKCAEFLDSSPKARQQWELERRFHVFEAGF